jgi:hypothetical protein
MKNKLLGVIALVAIITIVPISCSDGGGNNSPPPPPQEQPQKQPDTIRALSFGTDCKVTIKSDDLFLTADWNTLCNSVVAAIERGYTLSESSAQANTLTCFSENTVFAVLLKSSTKDFELKESVPYTIYFKANASVIDGIIDNELKFLLGALRGKSSYPTP